MEHFRTALQNITSDQTPHSKVTPTSVVLVHGVVPARGAEDPQQQRARLLTVQRVALLRHLQLGPLSHRLLLSRGRMRSWRQWYKNRSSRKIDSQRLFSREKDFPMNLSLTENQFSGKTYFYTIRPWALLRLGGPPPPLGVAVFASSVASEVHGVILARHDRASIRRSDGKLATKL